MSAFTYAILLMFGLFFLLSGNSAAQDKSLEQVGQGELYIPEKINDNEGFSTQNKLNKPMLFKDFINEGLTNKIMEKKVKEETRASETQERDKLKEKNARLRKKAQIESDVQHETSLQSIENYMEDF